MKAQTRPRRSNAGSATSSAGGSSTPGTGTLALPGGDSGADARRRAGWSLSGMKRIRSRRTASGVSSTITRFASLAQMRAKLACSSETRCGSGPQLV